MPNSRQFATCTSVPSLASKARVPNVRVPQARQKKTEATGAKTTPNTPPKSPKRKVSRKPRPQAKHAKRTSQIETNYSAEILPAVVAPHSQEQAGLVHPVVLDRAMPSGLVPVVLPSELRDPIGNYVLFLGGRQIVAAMVAVLLLAGAIFAGGFWARHVAQGASVTATAQTHPATERPATAPTNQAATKPVTSFFSVRRVPSDTLRPRRAAEPVVPEKTSTKADNHSSAAKTNQDPTRTTVPAHRSEGRILPTEPGAADGTRIKVGDIPVYVH